MQDFFEPLYLSFWDLGQIFSPHLYLLGCPGLIKIIPVRNERERGSPRHRLLMTVVAPLTTSSMSSYLGHFQDVDREAGMS